ncbi:TIGR03083 family protein [Paraoerskovia marina]|uniref:TIGR03083 family protein n=1 Tax=Paraoerskovia marina TaxID=545619 RepID=A0A1H1RTY0_9CELL|nr:maleylpyruvate isomerase family mycothiol-dependent enzyme [Paraoerskovia marina]SDS39144.1 TIGR03083 family protein [Paraoerskovia marina]
MTRALPTHPDPGDSPAGRSAPVDRLALLARAQAAFADVASTADPEAPVPGCGEWRVADVVLHLARVHWWAAGMAVGVVLRTENPDRPRDAESLDRIYRWAARHLHATLAETGPDSPALTLDGRGVAAYWWRRQLHETLIHLDDVATAAGTPAPTFATEVWADTVDEVVSVLGPARQARGAAALITSPVEIVATDTGDRWVVGDGDAGATVRGTSRDVALLLWNRIDLSSPGLEVSGDPSAVDALLEAGLTS